MGEAWVTIIFKNGDVSYDLGNDGDRVEVYATIIALRGGDDGDYDEGKHNDELACLFGPLHCLPTATRDYRYH